MSALTRIEKNTALVSLRSTVRALLPSLSWRHHGIGALQGYVAEGGDPEVRIHIWDPRLIKPGMADSGSVHDHRFDMVSHVLHGTVGHEEWFARPHPDGDHETFFVTHARAASSTNFHGPTTPTGERFWVSRNRLFISAGYTYRFPALNFHRSPVPEFAVTCVEKHGQRNVAARVLHPVELPPVMAFGQDMDQALCAELLRRTDEALR